MSTMRETASFIRWLPAAARRDLRRVVTVGSALALLEFAALLLLYPVLGVIADPTGKAATKIPVLGISVGATSAALVTGIALALLIGRSLAGFVVRWWWTGRQAEAERAVSGRLLSDYCYTPYSWHLQQNSSELTTRVVANVNLVCSQGLGGLAMGAADGALSITLAAVLLVISPTAGLVSLLYLGAVAGGYIAVSRGPLRRLSDRYTRDVGQVYSQVTGVLRGIREVSVFGAREAALADVSDARAVMVRSQRAVTVATDIPRTLLEVAMYGAVLGVLVTLIGRDNLHSALPTVGLFLLTGLRLMPALARLLGSVAQARVGIQVGLQLAAERVGQLSERSLIVDEPELGRHRELTLSGVSFRYPDSIRHALGSTSLSIPFGSSLGIIGPSGAGKSTLLALLLGLLEPTGGQLSYGGDRLDPSSEQWRQRLGFVAQDVFIVNGTLRANLVLGDRAATDEQVAWAMERAGLAHLVGRLGRGLDSDLGEHGSRLSIGERQRLGLARALVRLPDVLILDEPTAALDNETERRVLDTIAKLSGETTVVMVAHRLHTLEQVDQVLYLEDGSTAALGRPLEVLPMFGHVRA